jgi:hypothetical protein
MTDTIEAATKRLQSALDALEAALQRRIDGDSGEAVLAEQIHTLDSDRSRLAADLDMATARSRKLETANRDIVQRLDRAIATIRSVVGPNGR